MAIADEKQPQLELAGKEVGKKAVLWISTLRSAINYDGPWLFPGYLVFWALSLLCLLAITLRFERPVDDLRGSLKEVDDVAAESIVTVDSFDPDSKVMQLSVELRKPWEISSKMHAIQRLHLPDGVSLDQITYQYGNLSVFDESLRFILEGTKLNSFDLGVPSESVEPDDWKSQAPIIKECRVDGRRRPALISLR